MQRTSRGTAPASTTAWESSEKKNVRDLSVGIKIKELVIRIERKKLLHGN